MYVFFELLSILALLTCIVWLIVTIIKKSDKTLPIIGAAGSLGIIILTIVLPRSDISTFIIAIIAAPSVIGAMCIYQATKKSIEKKRQREILEQHRAREARLQELKTRAKTCKNLSEETDSVSLFLRWWADMQNALEEMDTYKDSVVFHYPTPGDLLAGSKRDFQWKLRNAIEREEKSIIEKIVKEYANSKEHRARAYQAFCYTLRTNASVFSDETKEFACNAAEDVYRTTGLLLPKVDLFPGGYSTYLSAKSSTSSSFSAIDNMEGHAFEHWCADLLKKNGYLNVSVTQGSGDQGVDVLAEKDGIKYAIQCKCYSSDLGNKPIQEVHTGKEYYNCHVGVVMTNRHFTTGAKQAAESTRTLLWDREKLQELMDSAKDFDNPTRSETLCPQCGATVSPNSRFCYKCGAHLI